MQYGQLIEYRVRKIFFESHEENEVGRLVSDLLLFENL